MGEVVENSQIREQCSRKTIVLSSASITETASRQSAIEGMNNPFAEKIWNNDAGTQADVAVITTDMVWVSQRGEKVHLAQRKQTKQSRASL
jgi:hypothetical protein